MAPYIALQSTRNSFKYFEGSMSLNGGVRDKDNQLYINNTEFAEDMADEHWEPLGSVF